MSKISYVHTKDFYIEKYTLKKPQPNMHYHHSYELYYILDGEREYFIGDRFFRAKKGDLVFVPANMLHRTDGKGATRILLFFKPEFISKYIQNAMLEQLLKKDPYVFHADAANDKIINQLFTRIYSAYASYEKDHKQADEITITGYLFQLLFLMYSEENLYVPDTQEDSRTAKIIKYINENYAYITGMDEISDKFFISKYYLCRIFKKSIGVSFISYLNTIRVKAACELLRSDELFLSEIAIRCGFNSTPYFCKVFKTEKGVSPSEYRKQVK